MNAYEKSKDVKLSALKNFLLKKDFVEARYRRGRLAVIIWQISYIIRSGKKRSFVDCNVVYYPVMLSHFSPRPRKNRSGGTSPIKQSSQTDDKGLQWKSTLDWLIDLHIAGKIALRV